TTAVVASLMNGVTARARVSIAATNPNIVIDGSTDVRASARPAAAPVVAIAWPTGIMAANNRMIGQLISGRAVLKSSIPAMVRTSTTAPKATGGSTGVKAAASTPSMKIPSGQ